MELRTSRELRRNARLDKIMGRTAETPDTPAESGTKPARTGALADKMALTQQAMEYIDRQREQLLQELAERRTRQQGRWAEAKSKSGELDLLSKQMKIMELCEKIAASVIRGDKVPPQDLKYLRINDPDGYRLAMALRRHKEHPEKVDSVLEDEENREGGDEGADGGESPSVEGSGSSGGGGDASAAAE